MANDQSARAQSFAIAAVDAMTRLLDAAADLEYLETLRIGINPQDEHFVSQDTKHLTAADLGAALGYNFPLIMAFIRDGSHLAVLNKIRR